MFGRLFGLRPLDKDKIRKSIYQPPLEIGTPAERKKRLEDQQIVFKNKFPFRPQLSGKKSIGLKTVVDSRKALAEGISPLLGLYEKHSAISTFFFAMGNEGRDESLFSLLDPEFYSEIKRTERIKREGFKTAFSGMFSRPGRATKGLEDNAGEIVKKGHDAGFYGFSPARWKAAVRSRSEDALALNYEYGITEFEELFHMKATAFAAPFFLCSNASILLQEKFLFDYASDCRGTDPFLPVIDPKVIKVPQVPVTLPTVREWLSAGNGGAESFYDHVLKESALQKYPVLEISPLYDGIAFEKEFSAFLDKASEEGFAFASLREVLGLRLAEPAPLPRCTLSYALVEGRRQEITLQMLEV